MQDDREIQEVVLEARLDAARKLMEDGQEAEAESLYKQALGQTETVAGESSPLVGLVLPDLIDFYDHFKRYDQGKALWLRLRHVVMAYLRTDEWGAGIAQSLGTEE